MDSRTIEPTAEQPARRRRLGSYGLAVLGPIASAGAQFLLSFQLLHTVDMSVFGSFSFLLVASQLSLGVSGALLCAPYPILLAEHAADPRPVQRTLFSANLVLALLTGLLLAAIALVLGTGSGTSALFGLYAAAMVLRWFGRAHAHAHGRAPRVAISDMAYGITLTGCILATYLLDATSLANAYLALLFSAMIGLLAFGWDYLALQFGQLSIRALLAYRQIWNTYSRWSLFGVVTTEGTANAHAYIVTLFGGPAAFAPIAASALLIRPVALAMNALTDFERPQMARLLAGGGALPQIRSNVRLFRLVLMLVWLASAVAALAVLIWQPRLLFPEQYSLEVIWTGAVLWLTIALIRTSRMPESVVLQAAGEFRTLAFASVVSCGVSIAIVGTMVGGGLLLLSLIGIAVGELVFAAGIWLRVNRMLARLA